MTAILPSEKKECAPREVSVSFSCPQKICGHDNKSSVTDKGLALLQATTPSAIEQRRVKLLAGIEAAHAELVKMSALLLSPPLIFLVFCDPVRGPPLLRATLAVMRNEGFDLGKGWGDAMEEGTREMPANELVFFKLLSQDGESVTHFMQQLGLMRYITREDLQKLSKKTQSDGEHTGLVAFKKGYPVVYAALSAASGLMMSNTRLTEQTHGSLRDSLKNGVSLDFTDARQAYIVNEEHDRREERRVLVRKKAVERKLKKGKSNAGRGGAKHDEHKPLQQMLGQQLLESGDWYKKRALSKIPPCIKQAAGIKRLHQLGSSQKDKYAADRKAAYATEKHARKTAVPKTMDEWRELAKATSPDNDISWRAPDDQMRIKDLERLAAPGFWGDLRVKDGFHQAVKDVLPFIWKDSMKNETKSGILPKIKKHLRDVHAIASKKQKNDICLVNVDNMDRLAILELFVKVDKTTCLADARKSAEQKKKLTEELLASVGTVIPDRKCYEVPQYQPLPEDEATESIDNESDSDSNSINAEN